MGSRNLSCAVTRFPIRTHDALRAIFVMRNPQHPDRPAGLLYNTDLWAPISLPISMIYNDFGEITPRDKSDWRIEMMLDALGGIPFEVFLAQVRRGKMTVQVQDHEGNTCEAVIGVMAVHEDVYERLTRDFYDLGNHTTPTDLLAENAELFRRMREMRYYNPFDLPETGSLTFWFQARSASGTVAIAGQGYPSPRDVAARIRAAAAPLEGAVEMEATCEMFVFNENLDALSIPYLPSMQPSDDFCQDLLREVQDIAVRAYAAEE